MECYIVWSGFIFFFFLFDWKRKICWLMYLKLGNKVWFRQRLIFCCTTVVAGEHFSHKSSRQFPVKLSNLPADNGLYFFICMFFYFLHLCTFVFWILATNQATRSRWNWENPCRIVFVYFCFSVFLHFCILATNQAGGSQWNWAICLQIMICEASGLLTAPATPACATPNITHFDNQ